MNKPEKDVLKELEELGEDAVVFAAGFRANEKLAEFNQVVRKITKQTIKECAKRDFNPTEEALAIAKIHKSLMMSNNEFIEQQKADIDVSVKEKHQVAEILLKDKMEKEKTGELFKQSD